MLVVTLLSIAIAGGMCFVSIKVGYKLKAIDHIVVEQPEKDKPEKDKPDNPQYETAFQSMLNTLKQMTIDKLISNSGQERMKTEEEGFAILTRSPIIGVGFGTYRTLTLPTNVLLGSGILRFNFIPCDICNCFSKFSKIQEKRRKNECYVFHSNYSEVQLVFS